MGARFRRWRERRRYDGYLPSIVGMVSRVVPMTMAHALFVKLTVVMRVAMAVVGKNRVTQTHMPLGGGGSQ